MAPSKFGKQPAHDEMARKGLSAVKVAELLGISPRHLRYVLRGVTRPSPEVREGLPTLLGKKLVDLFTPEALAKEYNPDKIAWADVRARRLGLVSDAND